MKRKSLDLGCGMLIEALRDDAGLYFSAMRRNSARFFRDPVEMRKWLGLPIKTPSREKFDEWLASLNPPAAPAEAEPADPTDQTRMVT